METMTDTPETDQAERESIAAYIEAYGPDALFPCDGYDHARKLERERDELREDLEFRRGLYALQTEALEKAREERDEARQWESQALVARIQRDEFSKTLGEIREMLCDAMPNENAPTSFMAATLVKERDEWKAKYIQQNKDLGCEQMDPNGTIWDHAKKLKAELDEARAAIRGFATP